MFDPRLLQMVPQARGYIVGCVAFQWLGLLANIALFFLIGDFIGHVWGHTLGLETGWRMLALAILAILARIVCTVLAQRMGKEASSLAKQAIRQQVYDKLVRLGPSYREHVATSEAVQVSVEGVDQLEAYFGAFVPQLFYALLAPVTLFVALAGVCLPAALVLLCCVPLIPAAIMAVVKMAKRVMAGYWNSYTDLGALFLESIQGLTTLKIYEADAAQHEAMNAEAERFRKATMRLLTMQLNSITVMDLFAYGGAAAGIIVMLVQYAHGSVEFAGAFAFVFLAADFFIPLRMLGSLFHTATSGMAAAGKMFRIIDVPEPAHGTRTVDPRRADVVCRGVGYSYDGTRQVLADVDFEAPVGSFVGITGGSGGGKSTLAGILAGTNAAFTGRVELGGVPLAEVSPASLRSTVTVVSYDSYLFAGTVRSNMLLAKPDATGDELWAALAAVRVDGFVRANGGLDMAVVPEGANLSGGQRQRIAMARALLHQTPIYIFDEATSNIDAASEAAVVAAIEELARTRTVIMISHRLAALRSCDAIYVLDQGRVAEKGTHDALLRAGGVYAGLWERQGSLEAFARGEAGGARLDADAPRGSATAPAGCGVSAAAQGQMSGPCTDGPVSDAGAADMAGFSTTSPAALDDLTDEEPPAPVSPGGSAHDAAQGLGGRTKFSVMLRMLGLMGPLAPYMALAVTLGVIGFVAAIFLIVFAAYGLLDLAGADAGGPGWVAACILVAACGVVRGPARYGEQLCNHYLAFRILALVRDRVFGALRRLAPAKLEGRDKGDLVALVTSDIELLEVFYAHTVSPVAIAALVSLIMTVFIAFQSPILALVALAAYATVGIGVPLLASRETGSEGLAVRQGVADLNAFVLESLRGLTETLRLGRARDRSCELASRMRDQAVRESRLKVDMSINSAMTGALVTTFDVAMVFSAMGLVRLGMLGLGPAVIACTALMASFGPVIAVASLGTSLQQTLASGARVLDILDERPQTEEVLQGAELDGFDGAEIADVSFSYGTERILDHVDLRIEPGKIVRIAGRSGSGKSTLLKLLMRFWDVDHGTVSVDGHDVRGVTTRSLRAIEGFMTQETHLFSGTVRSNLLVAKPDATDEELMAALRRASLDELVERLPDGLDEPLGELGAALSGGERQRLGLARVFLHDAPFVLLDEPTSNLDALNEAAVLEALAKNRDGRTVVLVSHRPTCAAIADVTYSVERGRVS